MIKKLIIPIIIIVASLGSLKGQDSHFSQFYANPLYLNPAMAGSVVCPRIVLNYRNQWPSISGTYVTYNASYDQHVHKMHGGLGFLVTSDRAGEGTLNTNTASLMYSYKLDITKGFSIKAGMQATFFQRSLDWEKLTFPDQIDPKYGFVYNTNEKYPSGGLNVIKPDFAAGVLAYGENYFLGFSCHHLTEPNVGFNSISYLQRRFTAHGGTIINLEGRNTRNSKLERTSISPNILYMWQQDFNQINYGFYLNKFPFVVGLWYRQNFSMDTDVASLLGSDAMIVLLGFQQDMFKFGYSYDLTVSRLKASASGGAHEFSFTLQLECNPQKVRVRAINCPSF